MSLYNMLFGTTSISPVLLNMLGITEHDVPRFRDCFLDVENKRIGIYTRTGGGNRDFYENEDRCRYNYPEHFNDATECPTGPWNDDLRKIKGFLFDVDDDFDCTYATFYYSFPDEFKNDLEMLCSDADVKQNSCHPSDKFLKFITELKNNR